MYKLRIFDEKITNMWYHLDLSGLEQPKTNNNSTESKDDKPSDEPAATDNQEEDSCYHSNDDLNEVPICADGEGRSKKESDSSEVNWDAENLEVSACWTIGGRSGM